MSEFANDSIKGVKELLELIQKLKVELKEVVKVSAEAAENIRPDKTTAKEIQQLTQAQQSLITAQKELTKIEKQEADLIAKISLLRDGQTKEMEQLKAIQSDLQKQIKQEAKEQAGLVGAYEKKSKHLRELKNQYKDLLSAEGKTTKETEKLRKQIKKLDKELVDLDNSVNDSFRNIGKYERAVERLEKDLIKLAAAGAVVAGSLKGVQGSLDASDEGSEELRLATAKLEGVMSVTKNTIAAAALDIWDFGDALFSGEKSLSDIGDAFNRTSKKIDTFAADIKSVTDANSKAELSQINLEKALRNLRVEIEVLNGEIAKQNILAGDMTRGMDSIQKAAEKALALEIQRNTILVAVAEQEAQILRDRIKGLGNDANALNLKNELSEKEIELITLKNELTLSTLELNKVIRENERDRFEKDLDYALDLFDTQKTLNERKIADEELLLQTRLKIFRRTQELSDKAFNEQIKLVEDYLGKRTDLEDLALIDDQKIIKERVDLLTTDEIVQQRILDIIRDRKTAVLDLYDVEKDLINEAIEGNKELVKTQRELIGEVEVQEVPTYYEDVIDKTQQLIDLEKQLTQALREELDKRNQAQIDSLNKKEQQISNSIDRQTELAAKGLDNQLEYENARLVQANLERKELLQKQQRQEEALKLAEAFISSFEARVQQDPNTALSKATQDVFLARGIAKALVEGFAFDGVEDTGEGGGMDNKNGMLWMLHPNERVLSKKQNKLIGDLTNDELSNLAYSYRLGLPINKEVSNTINDDRLINEIKGLRSEIKNKPVQQIDIDKLGNVIEVIDNGRFKKITKLKVRSRL